MGIRDLSQYEGVHDIMIKEGTMAHRTHREGQMFPEHIESRDWFSLDIHKTKTRSPGSLLALGSDRIVWIGVHRDIDVYIC